MFDIICKDCVSIIPTVSHKVKADRPADYRSILEAKILCYSLYLHKEGVEKPRKADNLSFISKGVYYYD